MKKKIANMVKSYRLAVAKCKREGHLLDPVCREAPNVLRATCRRCGAHRYLFEKGGA